jgi:SAM-dependent methyltransferase
MAITPRYRVTAIDISPAALRLYASSNPAAKAVVHADIFDLPFADATFDGIYNLGVMEHFTREEIQRILCELHRVLKPGGKIVIFWPHYKAPSVMVLGAAHWILRNVFGRRTLQLHPPEVSLTHGRNEAADIFEAANFGFESYTFDIRDLFIQAVVVGKSS